MKKLIAIDMDGTLLNSKGEISEENKSAITYAQENGAEVTIATGRAVHDVQSRLKETGLKTHIIGTNGATVHSKNGELLSAIPMDRNDLRKIAEWLHQEEFYFEVYTERSIFSPNNGKERMLKEIDMFKSANTEADIDFLIQMVENHFDQYGFTFFETYEEILEHEEQYFKVLAFSLDKSRLEKGWQQFGDMTGISIVSSADNNFEIQSKHASKGASLLKLSDALHIPVEQTMAIGDNYNDVSMFEKANISVAMGNAKEDIQAICKFTTETNDENGVANAIRRFVNGEFL